MKKRSELKIRLTSGLIVLMKGLSWLPLPWLRALGTALGELLWWVARSRRHIVLTNLRHCMPELDEARRHEHAARVDHGDLLAGALHATQLVDGHALAGRGLAGHGASPPV